MARTKLYTAIYVVLFVSATLQVVVEMMPIFESAYWTAFAIIMVMSVAKAVIVAAYYQHLRWEPLSLSYLILTGIAAALALTMAAAYSIT